MDVPLKDDGSCGGALHVEHHIDDLHSTDIATVAHLDNNLGLAYVAEVHARALDL